MASGCLHSPSVTLASGTSNPGTSTWHLGHPCHVKMETGSDPCTTSPGASVSPQCSLLEPNLGRPGKIWDYINSVTAEVEM